MPCLTDPTCTCRLLSSSWTPEHPAVGQQTHSASDATAGDRHTTAITRQLGRNAASDVDTALKGLAEGLQATVDTVEVTDTLAAGNPNGTVTLYAASHEHYVTQDTQGGHTEHVPGEAWDWKAYTFTTTNSTPIMTGTTDAAALISPLSPDEPDTAQPPSQATGTSDETDEDGTDAASHPSALFTPQVPHLAQPTSLTTTTSPTASGEQLKAISDYAWKYAYAYERFPNNDCTNYASSALHYAGRIRFQRTGHAAMHPVVGHYPDDTNWFIQWNIFGQMGYLDSWSAAKHNWHWQVIPDAPRSTHPADARTGYLIYTNWSGKGNPPSAGIGHVGIVTKKGTGNHLWISQHTPGRRNVPLYRSDQGKGSRGKARNHT